MPIESVLSGRAKELARAFDQSFAAPLHTDLGATIDFISIRLAGDPYAIRMTDIAGLFTDVKVTPCPSPLAELRGIAGFRSALTPVYDLGALLGYPLSSAQWLVLNADRTIALAFDVFEGHFRIEPAALAAAERSSAAGHVHEIARPDDGAWPVIDIASVASTIAARAAAVSSHKES